MEQEITDLYEKLNTELIKWCSMMTQDADMAREIVQEGFLRAIEHYDEIRFLDFHQKRAWLYRTIRHVFIDTLRKRKNECLTEEVEERASFDNYSEKEFMSLIEALDPLEGKIVVLRHLEGFSSKQIGEMLGLPSGTVRSKLHEARKHLREML